MEEDKLKILMTADTLGGVWNYALTLSKCLAPYNVEIHLATLGRTLSDKQKAEVKKVSNVIIYESSFKLEWMPLPWEDVELAKTWLIDLYKEIQPDLIHFNNFGQVLHRWDCPIVTVFHSCVMTWWKAVYGHEPEALQWKTYRQKVEEALSLSNMVIAPSYAILQQAKTVYNIYSPSMVIPHGTEELDFPYLPKEPLIFCAARLWDESKNIRALDKIAPYIDWPIYVAGDLNDPVTGKTFTADNIHLLGNIERNELAAWLQKAIIYTQPSLYEPFGLGVLEAASHGCTLILQNQPTFRELWNDAACFVDFKNPEEAIAKFNQIINNGLVLQNLSFKAKKRSKLYNVLQMAEKYISLYHYLIKSHKPLTS
ncbi:glycosyltransferase family 4 protein [Negadavirga shengliensis]|uniref:Glycosyltransferase family 4 protein n=1 Tax=Negadavirga shengliensis TaxID=1389218 RepID=A0ABV9T5L5_9BACT